MITQKLDLNLIPGRVLPLVNVSQYDKDSRTLEFTIYNGDTSFDLTGLSAYIQGLKPDGHGFNYSATISSGKITADVTEQMTAVSGRVMCEVIIMSGTDRIGTGNFILNVEAAAMPDGSNMSDSDYSYIEQLIEDAQEAVTDAEAWAVGERGGVPVDPSDPTYENSAHYWALQASGAVNDMTGATATTPGAHGLVPAPSAGDQDKVLMGDGTWRTPSGGSDMTGATAGTPGTHGLVPAPAAGDQDKYLKGDGTWGNVSAGTDFVGATAGSSGTHGLVPAPAAGQQDYNLKGDGTWGAPIGDMTGAGLLTPGAHGLVPAPAAGDQDKYLKGDGTWGTVSGGGGGHTIQNASGTDLTQRDTLQFTGGLKASDDAVNQKTIVDGAPTEITWAQYNALSPAEQAALEHTLVTDVPGADGTISADLMTKLWENSELSGVGNLSAFGAQTVALDLSEYDFVLVDTMYYARADRDSYIVPKGTVNFRMCHSQVTNASGYYLNIATRNVQMTDTGVAFGDCTYAHDSTAATTENLYMIPVRIYGIKKTVEVKFDALAKNVSTLASNCMLSDGVTSVEDILGRGEVSVTGDGVKTFTALLNELFALVDFSKLRPSSTLCRLANNVPKYYHIAAYNNSAHIIKFTFPEISSLTHLYVEQINVSQSGSTYTYSDTTTSGTSFANESSNAVPSGTKLSIIY